MRYAIFSDVHSNLEALESVLSACKKESIDQYFCVGDLVGYAANPKECVDIVKSIASMTVAGNHDWASVELAGVEQFNPDAKAAVLWTRKILSQEHAVYLESLKLGFINSDFTLVHGTLDNPREFSYLSSGYMAWETFSLMQTDICFVGHTHVPGVYVKSSKDTVEYREKIAEVKIEPGKKYIINVGSVGQPRDGNPEASYCLYDADSSQAMIKRVEYDFKSASQKIFDAGLPKALGYRLSMGR